MENNDQNPTQPTPQEENPQCDPTSADSSCCSAGSGGSKGWKTVILIVVLLLGAAVASRSLLQNTPKPPCCPAENGSPSGQCPSESTKPAYDQTKTTACAETKSAGCPSGKSSFEQAETPATAEKNPQGCPTGEKAAGSPCCPSATVPDALPKTCPKMSK